MKTLLDIIASCSFVLGWFVVIVGVGYLIPSLWISPVFVLICLLVLSIGVLLLKFINLLFKWRSFGYYFALNDTNKNYFKVVFYLIPMTKLSRAASTTSVVIVFN
ncbi:hypothetical protein SAMN04487936_103368 [Halobacillus dabanensis]|uniref:Uncharacterized protein n=1 Tax=Halobacillus dabanensis TaxID=240302 RepID=A0A1I3TFX0_HALDA|nr:hypothetical protein SAMN04487936_103368 [Halobacillus dabanensis]